jgi:methyl-accepting chemotaxis protein
VEEYHWIRVGFGRDVHLPSHPIFLESFPGLCALVHGGAAGARAYRKDMTGQILFFRNYSCSFSKEIHAMQLNLRAKFLIPAFTFIVLGISTLVTLSYVNMKDSLQETFRHDMLLLAKSYANDLSGDVGTKLKMLATWSKNPLAAAACQGTKPEEASAYLMEFIDATDNVLLLSYFDLQGLCTASTNIPTIGKNNLGDRDYFKAAVQEKKTNLISRAMVSRATNEPVVVLAQPVLGKDKKSLGIINCNIDLKKMTQQVSAIKIGSTGYVYILDQGGTVISHPNRDLILKDDLAHTAWGQHILAVKDQEIYEYEDHSKPMMAAVVKDQLTGWTFVAMAPLEDMDANLRALLVKNLTVAAATTLVLLVCLALAVGGFIIKPLRKTMTFASEVAAGHLNQTLDCHTKDEMGTLAQALRRMLETLKAKIAEAECASSDAAQKTKEATKAREMAEDATRQAEGAKTQGMHDAADKLQGVVEIVTSASEELSAQIEQSTRGSEVQSERIGETATAMEEMNATVLEVAKNASQAAETADKAKTKAQDGASIVKEVLKGIGEVQKNALDLKKGMTTLGQQAQGIGQIMNVISDIADQTNLLALNAAIEAARAGEAGRGFAVVADEVRKLAEKTMTATKEVGDAISGIQNGTQKNIVNVEATVTRIGTATDLAGKSGQALEEIVTLVDLTTDQVRAIATASEQQSSASEEINHSIEGVNQISAETADAMRQSATAVLEMADQAQVLKRLIDALREDDTNVEPGRHSL